MKLDEIKVVGILGPQGSGKGTVSKILSKKYGFGHINMGDICRRKMDSDPSFREEMSERMKQRELLPDERIMELFCEYINQTKESGLILDGIPRSFEQASLLPAKLISCKGIRPSRGLFIEIQMSRGYCHQRMNQRIQEMLHQGKNPREDDTHDALNKGIDTYELALPAIRSVLREKGFGYVAARATLEDDSALKICNVAYSFFNTQKSGVA